MSNTKHTPGPWELKMPKGNRPSARISGDGWEDFAKVFTRTTFEGESKLHDCEEGEANARLIAAAPELLETLKDMVGQYSLCNETLGEKRTLENARAAIAKAEGK
jgi:hypothetical protein